MLVKNDIDLIKACSNLLTFYLTNSMNLNAEFPTLLRVYLIQGLKKLKSSTKKIGMTTLDISLI